MKLHQILMATALGVALTGCGAVAASPVSNGFLFTSVQGPIDVGPGTATAKTGVACAQNVLGLFATGDASIGAAKAAGGITNVSDVDYDTFTVLTLYARFCTHVKGN